MVRRPPCGYWRKYHTVWSLLFMAWAAAYLDRSLTGPAVAWMIANDSQLLGGTFEPHTLGGLIGSMFFAGYMLTQFPAGYLGDRYGRRTVLTISTVWAGVATTVTGLSRGLTDFLAARVITGLGEGAFYSNDRALVANVSPPEKVGVGMGVVFVGLAAGMTAATISAPWLIELARGPLGDRAWAFPFLVFGPPTVIIGFLLHRHLPAGRVECLEGAATRLIAASAFFLIAIMSFSQLALLLRLGAIWQTLFVLTVALSLLVLIYSKLGKPSSAVLYDRSLLSMYISAMPILFTLWFFGFWALMLVSESSGIGLSGAAVYAALFGASSALGYPLGGVMCDRFPGTPRRKWLYGYLCLGTAGLVALMVPVVNDGDLMALGFLLFMIGATFSAMQTVHMTLTADLSPPDMLGQSFGMWNLIAQVGALLSPVLCGFLRDISGGWSAAIWLTTSLLVASAALVLSIPRGVRL